MLAVMKAGATIADALPGGVLKSARTHLYNGQGAGMATHQDMASGSALPYPLHIYKCPHACLRSQACMVVAVNDVSPAHTG